MRASGTGVAALMAVVIGLTATPVRGATVMWLPTAGTNGWQDGTNWSGGSVPAAGDDVVIANAGAAVLVDQAAPASGWLASLLVSNGAVLIFTNWNSTLGATSVTIAASSLVTLPRGFTNALYKNNIDFACSNLVLEAGAWINANDKGFVGGDGVPQVGLGKGEKGNGPAAGWSDAYSGQGASHGGFGAHGNRDATGNAIPPHYGSLTLPVEPGSAGGGGGYNYSQVPSGLGGPGGGAVRIEASGEVRVDGTIGASSLNPGVVQDSAGGGSGGSVLIRCRTFTGAGAVEANGGNCTGNGGGNGGGGRIAVHYDPAAQTALASPASVRFSVRPGTNAISINAPADAGTLYFPDAALFTAEPFNMQGHIYGPTAWAPDRLIVSNLWAGFNEEGFQLAVTQEMRLTGPQCRLEIGGSFVTNCGLSDANDWRTQRYSTGAAPGLAVGGSLDLTNGARLHVYGAPTNGASDIGALVAVTGAVTLADGCWIVPWSHPTNGGSPLFRMESLTIDALASVTNAGFSANGTGFGGGKTTKAGWGPAGGLYLAGLSRSMGGGHGGHNDLYGPVGLYGEAAAPITAGSGGGGGYYDRSYGCEGGGVIRIETPGDIRLKGKLSAEGNVGALNRAGGGAGGSVFLQCNRLLGEGLVSANGGNSMLPYLGGGGGAGRIAILYNTASQDETPAIQFQARGGNLYTNAVAPLYPGSLGTLYFPDTRFLSEVMTHSGTWILPASAQWNPGSLLISNAQVRFIAEGFRLGVSNNLTIIGPFGGLEIGGETTSNASTFVYAAYTDSDQPREVRVGGNLVLTNGASLRVCASRTALLTPDDWGARVQVGGQLYLGSNAWIFPVAHPSNGASVLFQAGSLHIADTNSGIQADSAGYFGGSLLTNGLGFGNSGGGFKQYVATGGGGHGGRGGQSALGQPPGGEIVGSSNAPVLAGGGGGGGDWRGIMVPMPRSSMGGGVVRVECLGAMRVDGLISANGGNGETRGFGGGAGGSVFLTCRRFGGSGEIRARGGSALDTGNASGGGGGGRVAIWRSVDDGALPSVAVPGGAGMPVATTATAGGAGTLVWGRLSGQGAVIVVR